MKTIPTLEDQFQDFTSDDKDTCLFEKFTISEFNCKEENALAGKLNYIKDLKDLADL